MARWAGFAP
jgi:hypothetical protein